MEIEVKLKYNDKEKIITWLIKNRFKLTKKKEIIDSYFGLSNNTSMSDINSFYRIRDIVGVLTELTLKDNFQENDGIKTRREINVAIDDPEKMTIILTSLGCTLFKKHCSKREIWEKGQVKFEFINYYKPTELDLIEIEGPNNKIIQTLIADLGNMIEAVNEEFFSTFDKKN